jgi:type II secretory pathway component PulF
MNDFHQYSHPDATTFVLGLALYFLLGFIPICALTYTMYFLTTLPMRRSQRARMFLDLVDYGLKSGRAPEAVIVDAAQSRDRSLGVRFQLLAAYIENGLRLGAALDKVPSLLPPQVVGILKMGDRIGNIQKVLPACRHLTRDAVSHVRSAMNYLILIAFVITPFSIAVPIVFRAKILPVYKAVFQGLLEGLPLPAFSRFVFGGDTLFTKIQLLLVLFVWGAMLAYLGGARLRHWVNRLLPGLPDAVAIRLPWRKKRLQRDFSSMLALLLDNEVPEPEAVTLAAESTANLSLVHRAAKVTELLKQGVTLPEAIRTMDDTEEFGWRLRNAMRNEAGFLRALGGWHEALDAKAFQLEQMFAQVITTALVLVNGLLIGSLAIAVFLALIQITNAAVLW